jgi:iron complex transport system ATP-binding protein
MSDGYCWNVPGTANNVLQLIDIHLRRDDNHILRGVNWSIDRGQHWIVLGANGSGKTSLLRIAALYLHPSKGEVWVTGHKLGDTDVRQLRRHVAYNSAAFATEIRPQLLAYEVVMTAKNAALEPWWHQYSQDDKDRAVACLDRLGVGHLAQRPIATLSSGEQQRVFLARTRMNDPALVLLDEPSGRLDLGGREQLVQALDESIASQPTLASAMVTHHVDEIPRGATHLLAVKDGIVIATGPIHDTISGELLSECFSWPLRLVSHPNGRFSAQSA